MIGSKTVKKLVELGHFAIAASPASGVDTLTGEGLQEALQDCEVVIDLANSPSFADADVMHFFKTSGKNLLAAEAKAGVKHHIALSVVGTDLLQASGYFRAKKVQEDLIQNSGIPYTIIHSTQFMEFLGGIVASSNDQGTVHLSNAKIQPIAADDVSRFVAEYALGAPVNGIVEIGGPERFGMADLLSQYIEKTHESLQVVPDDTAPYFGAVLDELTLVPSQSAKLGTLTFEQWFPIRPIRK